MKKKILLVCVLVVFAGLGLVAGDQIGRNRDPLPDLPKPEISEGERGELGIDKNINENNIDKYLGRSDSVYFDMRMLEDPANYSAIGGDSYLSGFVRGFEVIPLPFLTSLRNIPEEVGDIYKGDTLFTQKDGKYTANYAESEQILADLFPKDKNIFLMCGGGGYAGMTKDLLVKMGWNGDKIYVVGGYWFYEGKNKVEVKQKGADGKDYYAFWKVPYHEIDFSKLTKK